LPRGDSSELSRGAHIAQKLKLVLSIQKAWSTAGSPGPQLKRDALTF
jgi:hypothetical protein